jgi:hypothetical protein
LLLQSLLFSIIVFSLAVSVCFSLLMKRSLKDQIRLGLILFFSFFLISIGISWLIYPFP